MRNIVNTNIVLLQTLPCDPLIHMVWPVTLKLRSVSRCQTDCCRFDGSTPFPAKAAAARLPYRGLVWSGMPHRGQICRVGREGWHHNASLMPWDLFQQHPHATKGATHHFSLASRDIRALGVSYTVNLGWKPSLAISMKTICCRQCSKT